MGRFEDQIANKIRKTERKSGKAARAELVRLENRYEEARNRRMAEQSHQRQIQTEREGERSWRTQCGG